MRNSPLRLAAAMALIGFGTTGFVLPAHAQQASCRSVSPTRTQCRIDQPRVTQRMTVYSQVAFQPNDRVSIEAGGCVQTGGHGKTWKRYVDPRGPNSDRLYHGLIQIPGATTGLERIVDVRTRALVVPLSINVTDTSLRLGYEDDNYSDNGYWGHDDGDGNQCKGVGNAWVLITIDRSARASRCVGTPPADLASVCCLRSSPPQLPDDDKDGIPDRCEQVLAERFAPIVYHSTDESNFPVNVNWFLPKTSLWFYDDGCTPDLKRQILQAPAQGQLLGHSFGPSCGSGDTVRSDATRSKSKQRTFFLADVADQFRSGSRDTNDWITYVHAYLNNLGGVTIQYWRFYAYNDAINNHGGDWEGVHVILNRQLSPIGIGLLGHTSVDQKPWSAFTVEGSHPRVFSEGGGHATHERGDGIQSRGCPVPIGCVIDPNQPATFVRQETWPGGQVSWPDGHKSPSGGLLNMGEKSHPLNGQVFIQYSGIWGSPGTIQATSGYWGPVYNETGMRDDGFLTAWCNQMIGLDVSQECYPSATSR